MKRHLVGPLEDLPPGQRKVIDVDGRKIGVFNLESGYYALSNTCPHAGGPLCFGDVTGTTAPGEEHYELEWVDSGKILRCPWHAWEFYLSTGHSVGDAHMKVPTYTVILEDNKIYVEV